MEWEEAAAVVALGVGLASLYRMCVSPVVKDRAEAWKKIERLEAEVTALDAEIKRLKGGGP